MYTIRFTDINKLPIEVDEKNIKTDALAIAMFGEVAFEYGELLNENLLHLLENFACPEDGTTHLPDIAECPLLDLPTDGQLWYNSTRKLHYSWSETDSIWKPLLEQGNIQANWGKLCHGQSIPQPVDPVTGYVFPYSSCIWIVSPSEILSDFEYAVCTTDANAVVNFQYRAVAETDYINGYVNYLIVGIKNNVNAGTLESIPPPPTPTPSVTPTLTPNVTPSPTPSTSMTVTPTPTMTSTPTPTLTPTNTPTIGATPTATPTNTPTPTVTMSATVTPTPTITPSIPALSVVFTRDNGLFPGFTSLILTCETSSPNQDANGTGCGINQCSPEPGGTGFGYSVRITATGGVAPYNVKLTNWQGLETLTGSNSFIPYQGDINVTGPVLTRTSPVSTEWSGTITNQGGYLIWSGSGNCGGLVGDEWEASGNVDCIVTSANGAVSTTNLSWSLSRTSGEDPL